MLFARTARSEAADAVSGADISASALTPGNTVDALRERLSRIGDEAEWAQSHSKLLWESNRHSVIFWVLCSASMCFAILNGFHGFTTSGSVATDLITAIAIGVLYFTIEMTVPVSAHLMSWGSKGQARWAVRVLGIFAYCLGVGFSLLILQSKFSSGADGASARSEAAAAVFSTDKSGLRSAQETAEAMRKIVGARSSGSILAEIQGYLSQPITRGQNLSSTTDDCRGTRKTSKEKELCGKVDTLNTLHQNAIAKEAAEEKISLYSSNLMDTSRTKTKSADASDQVLAKLFGLTTEHITTFKASFIAAMAALLTHLLWAAHGMTVNASIAKSRDAMFDRNAAERALKREEGRKAATAQETTAAFLAATGSSTKVAAAVASAPLREQPVAIQMQRFFTDRAVCGDEFTAQIGIFHDAYVTWAKNNQLSAVPIDRFVQIVKDIGMGVSSDGRIVGAALRS